MGDAAHRALSDPCLFRTVTTFQSGWAGLVRDLLHQLRRAHPWLQQSSTSLVVVSGALVSSLRRQQTQHPHALQMALDAVWFSSTGGHRVRFLDTHHGVDAETYIVEAIESGDATVTRWAFEDHAKWEPSAAVDALWTNCWQRALSTFPGNVQVLDVVHQHIPFLAHQVERAMTIVRPRIQIKDVLLARWLVDNIGDDAIPTTQLDHAADHDNFPLVQYLVPFPRQVVHESTFLYAYRNYITSTLKTQAIAAAPPPTTSSSQACPTSHHNNNSSYLILEILLLQRTEKSCESLQVDAVAMGDVEILAWIQRTRGSKSM